MQKTKEWLRYVDTTFVRFVVVGGMNTLFGMGVYLLCIYIGLPFFVATIVSNVAGVLFNFKTTGKFVFHNSDKRLFLRFVACYVVIYIVNTCLVKTFLLCQMDVYWAGIVATPIMAVCSYFLLKTFVYKTL